MATNLKVQDEDLWQHKLTLSLGYALGLGQFTAINLKQPGYNYNITLTWHRLSLIVLLMFILYQVSW